jgi:hypothetical protein
MRHYLIWRKYSTSFSPKKGFYYALPHQSHTYRLQKKSHARHLANNFLAGIVAL